MFLGQTNRGINKFALPDDIAEDENNKSIYNVRTGNGTILKIQKI